MSPRRRLAIATLVLVLMVLGAGCLAWVTGGGEVSDERLDEEPAEPYNFETDRDAHIDVQSSNFQAVYRVEPGQQFRFHQTTRWALEEPLDIRAVRFKYAGNGTVVNGTTMVEHGGDVDQTPDEVYVTVPDAEGQLALSATDSARWFSIPAYVEGSYEVVLPPGHRIDFFLFSNVAPRDYESELVDDRVHLRWDEVSGGTVVAQSYRQRDIYIFGGAVVLLTGIAIVGLAYFRRQVQTLEEVRKSMGLDVEEEDDEDDGFDPPGR